MRRMIRAVAPSAILVVMAAGISNGQWTVNQENSLDNPPSTFMQYPTGGTNSKSPPAYYPYWTNYLDDLQKQGGYQSITGNYPNSVPITSYYPAGSEADYSGQGSAQPQMYSGPQDYSAAYSQGAAPQQPQYQSSAPQQYQGGYQQPAPTYQATQQGNYGSAGAVSSGQSSKSSKKRKSNAKQVTQDPYQQQGIQQSYGQQAYPQQDYQQQQAYQQQQGYQQQQQGAYPDQSQYQQQQAYQQQGAQQAQDPSQQGLTGDPLVQEAQRKAYERAVARQRAAELAAQQQAVAQELQQTQQMYMTAQKKLQEQEQRQRSLQQEYHKKAVSEAYDGLRNAQQKYYELVGVSGQGGRQEQPGQQQARTASQAPVQASQYPQQALGASQPGAQYPQPQSGYQQQPQAYGGGQGYQAGVQQPGYPSGVPGVPGGQQGAQSFSQAPTGQATPLHMQEQQQDSGGGFWGALKEIFAPSTPVLSPSQKSGAGQARGGRSIADF